jgi:hypothetical protein
VQISGLSGSTDGTAEDAEGALKTLRGSPDSGIVMAREGFVSADQRPQRFKKRNPVGNRYYMGPFVVSPPPFTRHNICKRLENGLRMVREL